MKSMRGSGTDSQRVGSLDRGDAEWMSCHAHELVDALPRSGATWRWGDVDLDTSTLRSMMHRGLIVQVDRNEQTWRTPRNTIRAIADYGGYDMDDVGAGCSTRTCKER